MLADNGPMLSVFRDAGFERDPYLDRGVVTVEMDTRVSERALRAADAREARAEAASLDGPVPAEARRRRRRTT